MNWKAAALVYGFRFNHYIRMFICAERTRNFELYISSLEKVLPYLAAAGHDKYIVAIQDFKNLSPYAEMMNFSGVIVLLVRSLDKY